MKDYSGYVLPRHNLSNGCFLFMSRVVKILNSLLGINHDLGILKTYQSNIYIGI